MTISEWALVLVGAMTAIGTLALAWTSWLVIRRDSHRQETEQNPNLVFHAVQLKADSGSGPDKEVGHLVFEATNLGRYPLLIFEVAIQTDDSGNLEEEPIHQAIQPGEGVKYASHTTINSAGSSGRIMFFFYYGATGRAIHQISLPLVYLARDGIMRFNAREARLTEASQAVSDYYSEAWKD